MVNMNCFCHPTCKRTTWAGKALRLLGRQGCVDRALGPERPHHPATQPTAPESSAAAGSIWNPAPASGQHGLHIDTPTRPVPADIQEGTSHVMTVNTNGGMPKKSLAEKRLAAHNMNRKLKKWLINNWAPNTQNYNLQKQRGALVEGLGPLHLNSVEVTHSKVTNLDISKVHTVKVREHLVDLSCILEDSTGCLGEVVQTCVATQGLGKSIGWCHLRDSK